MFSKKSKVRKVRFINLAEHLAIQNDIVSRTMDSMLLHAVNNEGVQESRENGSTAATSLSGRKLASLNRHPAGCDTATG